jgi:hypothetical protein
MLKKIALLLVVLIAVSLFARSVNRIEPEQKITAREWVVEDSKAYAQDVVLAWADNQYLCLEKLWTKESNWRPEAYNKVKVIVNGRWIGITENPIQLYNMLKDKKYKGIINIYTSIIFNYNQQEIVISNESGRLLRPLYKIKNNKLLITPDIIYKLKHLDKNTTYLTTI